MKNWSVQRFIANKQTNINKILPVGQPKIQSNKNVKTGKSKKHTKNK
jgi:hypothetical protein